MGIEFFFGETAINAEENKLINENYKNDKNVKKYFKDKYGSHDIRKLSQSSFFIAKSNIKKLDNFDDVINLSFDEKNIFEENEALNIDKKLNFNIYIQINKLLENKDKIKKGRIYKRIEFVDEEFLNSLEMIKNYAMANEKTNCPVCGKKFLTKERLLEAIEKKKGKYRLIETNNLYNLLLNIIKQITNNYFEDSDISKYLFDFDSHTLSEIKGMIRLISNYNNLCEKTFKSMSKYFGDININGKSVSEISNKFKNNVKKIETEKSNITNIKRFTGYIIRELNNLISIDNDCDFNAVPNKLEITISFLDGNNKSTLYDVLSESEIKRFSLVVLRALIKYGKYDTLILDDPIDSYDDYYLLVACDYIKNVVNENKLQNWYILTNNFSALSNISKILHCDSVIYYYEPDDIFTLNKFKISYFVSDYKEIGTISKNELHLLKKYLAGQLNADDRLSYISLIPTLRNFKTLILNNYDKLIVKKGRKISGSPAKYYSDDDYLKDIKKCIEHYYMHYDENVDSILGVNSNTIEVNRIIDLYNRVCTANPALLSYYSADTSSICSMREQVAKTNFSSFSGSKIINLVFLKICIVSYLKFEFEKQLIVKLRTRFSFSNSDIDLICNTNALWNKINKAKELNANSSYGAEDYLINYSEVFEKNKLLFNLFDHALEQMFPPYIATNVKDIKKFRIEIEELNNKF